MRSLPRYFTLTLLDGSVWGVLVDEIAQNRAAYYASEFGGDVERSLQEDTLPLFRSDFSEIQEWAVGNMNWSDFKSHVKLKDAADFDMQEAWTNAPKGFLN